MCATLSAHAQKQSNVSFMQAISKADVCVPFRYNDAGTKTPIEWGLDMAWLNADHIRTGVFYAGQDVIDIIRLSFQPTASVESGKFSISQTTDLNNRISAVKKWCKDGISYNINCDHASLDKWYNEGASTVEERAKRWAKLIDMTADYYKKNGLTNLVSISPLNEPDYEYHQLPTFSHRMADFKAICKLFKEDEAYKEKYKDVRLCGGNTLNADKAYDWWNYLKTYLDEGNTHQLAGSFDKYSSFFQTLTKQGHHASNDELHNVMEAMVGVEYGMQTGIWWGTCEKTRSDFMKATDHKNPGDRLGYGEHRANWTSASVYRHPNGRVQAFGGSSERQAVTTSYNFLSTDKPVWFEGIRSTEYRMNVMGGTGYQIGQTNYENAIDIQDGEDIMPHITDGVYKIVNAKSGKVMGFSGNPGTGWSSLKQVTNTLSNNVYQQWKLNQVKDGDRGYYILELNGTTPLYIDILNWNYESGADVGTFPGSLGTNEQWYLEYADNNAFYIRSRYSTKCLEVSGGSTTDGANIQMADLNGTPQQKWKFVSIDTKVDNKKPSVPTNLQSTAHNASIELSWTEPSDKDIIGYTILRSEDGENFYTLCKGVTETTFVDNEANDNVTYYYKVYAEDKSMNRGAQTEIVSAATTQDKGMVMHVAFDDHNLYDNTENANHCIFNGSESYFTNADRTGLTLDGATNFLQLPYTIANHDAITISVRMRYRGGNMWARIFDFGNGTDQYMFLTANDGTRLRFAIKNGGEEQIIRPAISKKPSTTEWSHVVVTLENGVGIMYFDGEEIARNENITIKPSDINPVLNYVGRSQFTADPMLKAYVNEIKIYNYALSAEEIKNETTSIKDVMQQKTSSTTTFDINGRKTSTNHKGIVVEKGKKYVRK